MIRVFLCVTVLTFLTACGHKGGLKSPAQIEAKAAKEDRKERKEKDISPENVP